jgi:CubicO group peptidase (beta-lactamase class C family)
MATLTGQTAGAIEVAARLQQLLLEDVEEMVFGTGAQAALYVSGQPLLEVATGSAGPGVAMSSSTLQNVWCASKPLLAMAVLRRVEYGDLDFDEPVGEQFPTHEALRLIDASPRQLLCHTAGLAGPRAYDALFARPADRLNAVVMAFGRESGYSEYAAWRVLDELLSVLSGTSAARVVMREVVEPLGLGSEVLLDLRYADHLDVDHRFGAVYPSLPFSTAMSQHDQVVYLSRSDRVVTGASMTARALCTFYARLLDVYHGAEVPGLPRPATLHDALARSRGHIYDAVLERECDFAAGFMIDLASHGMAASLPRESFGHSGMTGSIFALANPATRTAIALVFNGANTSIDDARLLYRRYSALCT